MDLCLESYSQAKSPFFALIEISSMESENNLSEEGGGKKNKIKNQRGAKGERLAGTCESTFPM